MNHVIILAGGVGSRMHLDIPKQYYEVHGKPVIMYSLLKFLNHPLIDSIVLVLAGKWRKYMEEQIDKVDCLGKSILWAEAGKSRQHSVLSGLSALRGFAQDKDKVLVHDAVRPLFPLFNIDDGIAECESGYDAALPVITVKDATYQSTDGQTLSRILPRQELFSGQSPECFVFGSYLEAHSHFSDDEIASIRGGVELAYRAGLKVKMIKGLEQNIKLTTLEDLRAFELVVNGESDNPR